MRSSSQELVSPLFSLLTAAQGFPLELARGIGLNGLASSFPEPSMTLSKNILDVDHSESIEYALYIVSKLLKGKGQIYSEDASAPVTRSPGRLQSLLQPSGQEMLGSPTF